MQHTQATTAGTAAVESTGVGPVLIWVLVAGVVLLLAALGPSVVTPAATAPAGPVPGSPGASTILPAGR